MSLPPITLALLVVNVVFSLAALLVDQRLIEKFSFKPYDMVKKGEWYRMITGAFLHGGFGHLAINMYVLYNFGSILEAGIPGTGFPIIDEGLGPLNYQIIYFGSIITAHLLTYLKYKNDPGYSAVGASGAISGLLVAFSLAAPTWGVGIILLPGTIPAILFSVLFIAFSWYAGRSKKIQGFGRIAHEAHLGGALGGLVLTLILYPRVIGDMIAVAKYYLGG